VVELLPSKHKAVRSNPRTEEKREKEFFDRLWVSTERDRFKLVKRKDCFQGLMEPYYKQSQLRVKQPSGGAHGARLCPSASYREPMQTLQPDRLGSGLGSAPHRRRDLVTWPQHCPLYHRAVPQHPMICYGSCSDAVVL
jgi:hypothetical protein